MGGARRNESSAIPTFKNTFYVVHVFESETLEVRHFTFSGSAAHTGARRPEGRMLCVLDVTPSFYALHVVTSVVIIRNSVE